MRGFTKAVIAGNLTRDPELRTTPSGATVCSFTIAVNRVYRDASGEQKEEVSYIDCSAWGKPGETINQYCKKGTPLLVSGRLLQRSWDDKNTGAKRSKIEVVMEDFVFVGGGRDGDSGYSGAGSHTGAANKGTAGAGKNNEPEVIPDEIPEGEISIDEVPF